MELGIEKIYVATKSVRRKLILNDKVVDYLLKRLSEKKYVFITGYSTYKEITRGLLKQILRKAEQDERYWYKEIFAELADYPEYEDVPFEVTHASPYDHRWPGDYDEDAYDDWKVVTTSLMDLFYLDYDREPVFAKYPDKFDFEEEVVVTKNDKYEGSNYTWR